MELSSANFVYSAIISVMMLLALVLSIILGFSMRQRIADRSLSIRYENAKLERELNFN